MPKTCDNKSVGVIIRRGDKFAVIKRANFPVSYAMVAGHLDGDTFTNAAVKEAREEARVEVTKLAELLSQKFENPCKRRGGSWHEWKIYEATEWNGELRASSDAAEAFWATADELKKLADRTLYFSAKLGIPIKELARFIPSSVFHEEWKKSPGLEAVWLLMLQRVGIL